MAGHGSGVGAVHSGVPSLGSRARRSRRSGAGGSDVRRRRVRCRRDPPRGRGCGRLARRRPRRSCARRPSCAPSGTFRRGTGRRDGGARRMDRGHDGVVDRSGPKLGLVQQDRGVRGVPRARDRPRRRRWSLRHAPRGSDARSGHRRNAHLRADRQSGAGARPPGRSRRTPPRAGRLLERTRPPRRHGARARALARHGSRASSKRAGHRRAARVCRDAVAPVDALASRRPGRRWATPTLARLVERASRERPPARCVRRAGGPRRRLGIHEARAHRGRRSPLRPNRGRKGLRRARSRRRRDRGRARRTGRRARAVGEHAYASWVERSSLWRCCRLPVRLRCWGSRRPMP